MEAEARFPGPEKEVDMTTTTTTSAAFVAAADTFAADPAVHSIVFAIDPPVVAGFGFVALKRGSPGSPILVGFFASDAAAAAAAASHVAVDVCYD